jgi:hypothetical protein
MRHRELQLPVAREVCRWSAGACYTLGEVSTVRGHLVKALVGRRSLSINDHRRLIHEGH